MTRPAQRRELAEKAVATKGVSIALACRAFGVSETCFRYSPKRYDENEMIADLLVGLTNVHKTVGHHGLGSALGRCGLRHAARLFGMAMDRLGP